MKKVFCPKCDNLTTFDETKYPAEKPIALVCSQCGSQFNVKLGKKKIQMPSGKEKEVSDQDFSNGYISVIANFFGDKQEFALQLGDNVIGRRNRDTDGVDIAIINTDPSMGRKHCVINVKKNASGKFIYTLRDFPSLTGTFLNNNIPEKYKLDFAQASEDHWGFAAIGSWSDDAKKEIKL